MENRRERKRERAKETRQKLVPVLKETARLLDSIVIGMLRENFSFVSI